MPQSIPKSLQSVLWSVDIDQLDIARDKRYIIHQVLLYGSFEDIRWLFETYAKKEIVHTFLQHPSKIYPKAAFYFIKNFILHLKHKKLSEEKYVTSIFGPVKPRAARSL